MTASRRMHPNRMVRVLVLVGGMGLVLAGWSVGTFQYTTVTLNPGDDIQAAVDQHPEGTHFSLNPGVYQQQSILPKNGDSFEGHDGAVLSGARLLTGFKRQGQHWVAAGATEEGMVHGDCLDTAPRCAYPEVVYLDGEPLRHAAGLDDLGPGAFFFDYDADRIYLADDPEGHTVELGVTGFAFAGEANDVTITNLTIEKYANWAQMGAIYGYEGKNWTVTGNLVQLNHGVGIVVGDGMQVRGNRSLRNGQMGITGKGTNVVVEGNEIADNNFAGYDPGWEAGGTKFVDTRNLILRNNYVHGNNGPGLWTDYDNVGSLIEGNLVVANAMMGIFHEISYQAIIRDNVVLLNSPNFAPWAYGAQIQISSSADVEVRDNRVVVSPEGGNGIVILEQDRGKGAFGPHLSTNNRVLDNTIVFLGAAGQAGAATDWQIDAFWTERKNLFDGNRYVATDPTAEHWTWDNRTMSWDEFRAQGQEPDGTLSMDVPADVATVPAWALPSFASPLEVARTPRLLLAGLGALLALAAAVGLTRTFGPRRQGERSIQAESPEH